MKEASPLLYNQVLPCCSSDGIAGLALTSGTAQQVTLPVGARAANFSFNVDIWVAFGTTQVATIPTSYTTVGSTFACEFNPTMRYFTSTVSSTALSIISPNTGVGSVSFYK